MEVISILISAFALAGSGFAIFLAARNPEVHVYHEQDTDQCLPRV